MIGLKGKTAHCLWKAKPIAAAVTSAAPMPPTTAATAIFAELSSLPEAQTGHVAGGGGGAAAGDGAGSTHD
jgi:hypothetical protein